MRHLSLLLLLSFSACASNADTGNVPDGGASDGNPCGTIITFDPAMPEASDIAPIRARVEIVNASGVLTYAWNVTKNGSSVPFTMEAADNSQIGFIAATTGPYDVSVSITPAPAGCSAVSGTINVLAPGANTDIYRLRTVPPTNAGAPPQEQIIQIRGGADYSRAIGLDPGGTYNLSVQQSGTGVPAYVKLMPVAAPHAFTEVFTSATGTFAARLLGQTHNVLVIPTSVTLAPRMTTWSPTSPAITVGPGTVVTGVVTAPGGGGLSGAKVQLTSGGVPSTLATTAGDGSFSVRADFFANAMITVKVTPGAASGLPRLEATGQFALGSSMQITYAAGLATCDLANTPVRRSAVNQANAKVTVVGTLPGAAGSVVAGVSVNASGSVRVAATASGGGLLPSTLVPRAASLSAVTTLANGELAVDTIDTSACAAQVIDAPAQLVRTGTVRNISNAVLGGVRVEATPVGVLARADAQTVAATTASNGTFSLPLASGGRYDVRFIDAYARAAPLEGTSLTNITPASVPTAPIMPKALVLSGKVSVAGSTQPLPGASIQILCATCNGIAATKPVAETATNSLSDYRIAVPDPGTQ